LEKAVEGGLVASSCLEKESFTLFLAKNIFTFESSSIWGENTAFSTSLSRSRSFYFYLSFSKGISPTFSKLSFSGSK
jgi:hypothetical protein